MTINELYEWAVDHGISDANIAVFDVLTKDARRPWNAFIDVRYHEGDHQVNLFPYYTEERNAPKVNFPSWDNARK